ncbi:Asp-tRNAAsn/Glu-tRNAGln amidotransferase A subunit [Hoeflea phototrophica DFL-43]|jgi:aspartyl-tRNA(Asn)/glutamyl-tRNA(Gln) amidotransferase subunit A|uniref:Indoleacetamide hydrolase n=1 Tax=Hoeflea phototrophica (strain DSM 17068 / NCIMB 14078 / DFL-43) TaxID=411684 RepID=A9D7J6_HOEPD|nr:amidase [Hoeflea phototrophica]EDQ33091.1 Asp-tRNAAsn/Glu-tRNAGln amidotransferase A subunit [Hoeflea phototrophica DFL-43]
MSIKDKMAPAAHGFDPTSEAWALYGGLVEATLSSVDGMLASVPADAVELPAGKMGKSAPVPSEIGYGPRGTGDLCDLVAQLTSGETSPTKEVAAALERASARDNAYHGVIALEADRAMADAEKLEAKPSAERGILAGAPYARKDLFKREGYRAENGALIFKGQIADNTSTVIERLDAAGGIDIGRLAMAELAMSPTGFNAHTKHPRNPWNPAHVTGGSSSGSAVAVAAGYVRFALGTDTGGSIRHPAAMSGLTGIKPTANRVSRAGVWPLSWSLDCVGPLARSARDCGLVLDLISGLDPRDTSAGSVATARPPLTGDLSGKTIAVPKGYYFETVTPAVKASLDAAIETFKSAGATIVETAGPAMTAVNTMAHLVLAVEASAQLAPHFTDPDCSIGRQVRDRLEPGMFYSGIHYATALRVRATLRGKWIAEAMEGADIAFIPAIACEVPTIEETTQGDPKLVSAAIAKLTHTTRGINYLGLPALVAPCGEDAKGLPIAFQLVGRPDDEASLIEIADAFQLKTDWHTRTPTDRSIS